MKDLCDESGDPEKALDREKDELSDEELERALQALRHDKAPGWDAIFVEAYVVSPSAKSDLFSLIRAGEKRWCRRIWRKVSLFHCSRRGQWIIWETTDSSVFCHITIRCSPPWCTIVQQGRRSGICQTRRRTCNPCFITFLSSY